MIFLWFSYAFPMINAMTEPNNTINYTLARPHGMLKSTSHGLLKSTQITTQWDFPMWEGDRRPPFLFFFTNHPKLRTSNNIWNRIPPIHPMWWCRADATSACFLDFSNFFLVCGCIYLCNYWLIIGLNWLVNTLELL